MRATLAEASRLPVATRREWLCATLGERLGERAARSLARAEATASAPSFLAPGGALHGALGEELLDALLGERAHLAPGTRIGRLRVEHLLGEGGMGAVYAGFDEALERKVAIKTLGTRHRLTEQAKSRLRREAQMLSRLDHPDICRIHDLIETADGDFLVLEYVEGENLGAAMARGLPAERQLEIAERLSRVLAAAHAERVIHRDLKPDNVMLGPHGEVKVLDFGIARTADELERGADAARVRSGASTSEIVPGAAPPADAGSQAPGLTLPGAVIGTPAYMSPEQARGEEIGTPSDVYSLGLLLQELFTGRSARPAGAESLDEILQAVRDGRRATPEGLASALATLLDRMTATDPAARPTAAEVAERLAWHRTEPLRRRRRGTAAGIGLAASLAVLLAAWTAWSLARPAPLLEPGTRARLALLPIVNATGDPAYDWVEGGLRELAAAGLERLPDVELVEVERLRQLAAGGGPDSLERVAVAVGATLVIAGRIEGQPGAFLWAYTTRNANGETSVQSLRGHDLTAMAGSFAQRLARRLRPEAPPVDLGDRLADDPTLNYLYALGVDRWLRGGQLVARPYFAVCVDQDPDFAWAELRLALCEMKAGELEPAQRRIETVVTRARDRRDAALERAGLLALGNLALERGDHATARQHFATGLRLARAQGHRTDEMRALNFLAIAELSSGDPDAATAHHAEALARARELGDPMQEGYNLNNLGLVHWRRQELDRARELFERALELGRRTAVLDLEAAARNNLGILAHEHGNDTLAADHLTQALRLDRAQGDRRRIGERATNLAIALTGLGRLAEAEPLLSEAYEIFTALGNERARAFVDRQLAELHLARGDAARAAPHLERAAPLFPEDRFSLTLLRARARYLEGDLAGAATLARQARREAGKSWPADAAALADALLASARAGRRLPLPGPGSQVPADG